jgi:hypothetical protein
VARGGRALGGRARAGGGLLSGGGSWRRAAGGSLAGVDSVAGQGCVRTGRRGGHGVSWGGAGPTRGAKAELGRWELRGEAWHWLGQAEAGAGARSLPRCGGGAKAWRGAMPGRV